MNCRRIRGQGRLLEDIEALVATVVLFCLFLRAAPWACRIASFQRRLWLVIMAPDAAASRQARVERARAAAPAARPLRRLRRKVFISIAPIIAFMPVTRC